MALSKKTKHQTEHFLATRLHISTKQVYVEVNLFVMHCFADVCKRVFMTSEKERNSNTIAKHSFNNKAKKGMDRFCQI